MNSKMLARNVFPIARTLLRANGAATTRVAAYHKESLPPTTMNDLPVPQGSWQADYDMKQRKYNIHLVLGVSFALFSIGVATQSGLIDFNFSPPELPDQ